MSIEIFSPTEHISWTRVALSGPDTPDFLHRLTTVDVRGLQPGQGSPGFFLNAQGRIRASFTLWRLDPQSFVFELDAGADGHWRKELLLAIDQYTFAEKMTLVPEVEGAALWVLGAEIAGMTGGSVQLDAASGALVCHHGSRDFGRAWITLWGSETQLAAWCEKHAADAKKADWPALDHARVAQMRPWIGSEITEHANPLELGLIDGVADQKGCYPGQEVIEKIIALGAPARRLVRVEGVGAAPSVGDPVYDLSSPPAEIGKLTSISSGVGKYTALALVRKNAAQAGTPVLLDTEGTRAGKIAAVAEYKRSS
jgi:folate-binding protein YgfZ